MEEPIIGSNEPEQGNIFNDIWNRLSAIRHQALLRSKVETPKMSKHSRRFGATYLHYTQEHPEVRKRRNRRRSKAAKQSRKRNRVSNS